MGEIFVPKEARPDCHKCGRKIFYEKEPKKKIHTTDDHNPIHSKCLVLHSKKDGGVDYQKVAKGRMDAFKKDLAEKEKIRRGEEKKRVGKIAKRSQDIAKQINPDSKLDG